MKFLVNICLKFLILIISKNMMSIYNNFKRMVNYQKEWHWLNLKNIFVFKLQLVLKKIICFNNCFMLMFVFMNLLINLILKKLKEKDINGLYRILLENKDLIKIKKIMIKKLLLLLMWFFIKVLSILSSNIKGFKKWYVIYQLMLLIKDYFPKKKKLIKIIK